MEDLITEDLTEAAVEQELTEKREEKLKSVDWMKPSLEKPSVTEAQTTNVSKLSSFSHKDSEQRSISWTQNRQFGNLITPIIFEINSESKVQGFIRPSLILNTFESLSAELREDLQKIKLRLIDPIINSSIMRFRSIAG